MAHKLGLRGDGSADEALFADLDATLRTTETDMTIFFRRLAALDPGAPSERRFATIADALYRPDAVTSDVRARFDAWLARYVARLEEDGVANSERAARMNAVNPNYVLRNYLAQEAIDAAERGDDAPLRALMDVVRRPYDDDPRYDAYAAKRPDWARNRAGCSMLSCSS
jgi:uncharacterized protein YdiU (UPF0061 family)